jgi:branched-chain amino acid transport system substrate-binding protein
MAAMVAISPNEGGTMKSKIAIIITLLAVVSLLVSSCGGGETQQTPTPKATAPSKVIKIGVPMALTGPASAWGQAIKPQMEVYAELINEDGGIKIGNEYYKVQLFFGDDKYTAEGASSAAQKLVYSDKVQFVLGYYAVADANIEAVTEPAKVIYFGHGLVPSDWKAADHRYTVFTNASVVLSYGQPRAILDAYPDTKKVGFLVFDSPTTPDLIRIVTAEFAKAGVDCISEVYESPATNFVPQLAKFKQAGVNTLFCWSTVGEFALAMKQAHEAGYNWHFAQPGTMLDVDEFITLAGYDAAQGSLSDWPNPMEMKKVTVKPELKTMAQRIMARYEQKYGKPMTYMGGFGYGLKDMSLLIEVLQRAGTTDHDKVYEELWGGTFDTFIGRFTMHGEQTYGGPVALGYPCVFGKIQGNQMVYAGEYPTDIP